MSNIKYLLSFFLCLMSFNSFAHWASTLYEPMPTQILWRANVDIFESTFQAKIEPRYLDAEKKEFTYDLKIYGTKKGVKYLAYEENDIGHLIYSMTTTDQGYSPLIIVSADDDKGDKVIRAYQFKENQVTLGAKVRSIRSPETLLYPGESGMAVIYSKFDNLNNEKFYRIIFVDSRWILGESEQFSFNKSSRYKGLCK